MCCIKIRAVTLQNVLYDRFNRERSCSIRSRDRRILTSAGRRDRWLVSYDDSGKRSERNDDYGYNANNSVLYPMSFPGRWRRHKLAASQRLGFPTQSTCVLLSCVFPRRDCNYRGLGQLVKGLARRAQGNRILIHEYVLTLWHKSSALCYNQLASQHSHRTRREARRL